MKPMPTDLAIAVLTFAGTVIGFTICCWAVVNYHSNRVAFWATRIAVWIGGSAAGYVIAWAIYSLLVGGAQ